VGRGGCVAARTSSTLIPDSHPWRHLDQAQAGALDVDHGEIGDDPVHNAATGEGELQRRTILGEPSLATGTQPLRESALWRQLDLEFAAEVLRTKSLFSPT